MLRETIEQIREPDAASMQAARAHFDALAKPLHGLGSLEDLIVRLAGIRRSPEVSLARRALVVLCADNGVVEEGVTQTGQEVTAQVAEQFRNGQTCTAIMAKRVGAELFVYDLGMARDTRADRRFKIAPGTGNLRRGPAMSRQQAERAVEAGIRIAQERAEAGCDILLTGEMGIGNTTTSSAVTAALLQLSPEEVTGRGAGLSDEGLARKREVIAEALALNRPDPEDALEVLAKVGGFDLAGLTGVFLGGAACGLPVVVDGLISAAAALSAVRLCPAVRDYLIPSHLSREPAARHLAEALGLAPCLDLAMNLGEGSGGVLLLPLLDLALAVYREMITFADAGIPAYVPQTGGGR